MKWTEEDEDLFKFAPSTALDTDGAGGASSLAVASTASTVHCGAVSETPSLAHRRKMFPIAF